MELLALALIELVVPLATAALALFANLVILLADLAALAAASFSGFLERRRNCRKEAGEIAAASERQAQRPRRKRWAIRILTAASALLLILLSAAAVANLFFFDSLTRWAFGQLEKRAGISISFERAEGSFWKGEFAFVNLKAARSGHPVSDFELKVNTVELDVSMGDLVRQNIVFDSLTIEGVEGLFEQKVKGGRRGREKKNRLPRRGFELNNFSLENLSLDYANFSAPREFRAELKLDYFRSDSIAGDSFVSDLLFKANASGSLNGLAFSLINDKRAGEPFKSIWLCRDMPVTDLAALMGGPFDWFESGLADLAVANRQLSEGEPGKLMEWKLSLRDFQVRPPADSSAATRISAAPLINYLNRKSDGLELGFSVEIKDDDLKFASTADLSELLIRLAGESFKESLTRAATKFRALGQGFTDRLKEGRHAESLDDEAPIESAEEDGKGGRLKSWLHRPKRGNASP